MKDSMKPPFRKEDLHYGQWQHKRIDPVETTSRPTPELILQPMALLGTSPESLHLSNQSWTLGAATVPSQYPLDHSQAFPLAMQPPQNFSDFPIYGDTNYPASMQLQDPAQPTQFYYSSYPSMTSAHHSLQPIYNPFTPYPVPQQFDTTAPAMFAPIATRPNSTPMPMTSTPWSPAQYSSTSAFTTPTGPRGSFSSMPEFDVFSSFTPSWSDDFNGIADPRQAAQALTTMSAAAKAPMIQNNSCCPLSFTCAQEETWNTEICSEPCDLKACDKVCLDECLSECFSRCSTPCFAQHETNQCSGDICTDDECLKQPSAQDVVPCCLYIKPTDVLLDSLARSVPPNAAMQMNNLKNAYDKSKCLWSVDSSSGQLCHAVFDDPIDLQGHLEDVHIAPLGGSVPLICSWYGCLRDQEFDQKAKLKRHVRMHSKSKTVACHLCIETFADKHSLDAHLRSHTGERPFICDVQDCVKTFAHKSLLTQHLRSHWGEKPFECDFPGCKFATADSSNLSKHKKIHKDGTYKCLFSGCTAKPFHKPSNLRRHEETHARRGKDGKKPTKSKLLDLTEVSKRKSMLRSWAHTHQWPSQSWATGSNHAAERFGPVSPFTSKLSPLSADPHEEHNDQPLLSSENY